MERKCKATAGSGEETRTSRSRDANGTSKEREGRESILYVTRRHDGTTEDGDDDDGRNSETRNDEDGMRGTKEKERRKKGGWGDRYCFSRERSTRCSGAIVHASGRGNAFNKVAYFQGGAGGNLAFLEMPSSERGGSRAVERGTDPREERRLQSLRAHTHIRKQKREGEG